MKILKNKPKERAQLEQEVEATMKFGGDYTFHVPSASDLDHYKITFVRTESEHCQDYDREESSSWHIYYVPS